MYCPSRKSNGGAVTSGSEDSDLPNKRVKQTKTPRVTASISDVDDDDDDDNELSDEGDMSDSEVVTSFSIPYHLESETSVSCSNVFIIHMSGTSGSNPKIAVALTDHTCSVYGVDNLMKVASLSGHKTTITNVRFSPTSEHLLYSSSLDGLLKLWDLRMKNKCVDEFKDATDGEDRLKPLTSFDMSCNDSYLCAGTELIGGDAFLLYWDVRTKGLLGGYWESHTDDVTQVAFHPSEQNTVATGSTDGLINVFDIGLESEEDALQYCLNTESSVDKVGWFSHGGSTNTLSCITHTEHLQLWETDGAAPYVHINRDKLTEALCRNPSDNCYLVNVHCMENTEDLMVVAGSAAGNGHCLRTLRISDTSIRPMSDLVGNRQVVRASWQLNDVLVTGGESGFISVWKPGKQTDIPVARIAMKAPSNVKHLTHKKSKPY